MSSEREVADTVNDRGGTPVGRGKARSGKHPVNYLSVAMQFIIAVLLAFIGFTLQGLRTDTANSLAIGQANQVSISRIDSKLDNISARMDRLERIQDDQIP